MLYAALFCELNNHIILFNIGLTHVLVTSFLWWFQALYNTQFQFKDDEIQFLCVLVFPKHNKCESGYVFITHYVAPLHAKYFEKT